MGMVNTKAKTVSLLEREQWRGSYEEMDLLVYIECLLRENEDVLRATFIKSRCHLHGYVLVIFHLLFFVTFILKIVILGTTRHPHAKKNLI